MRLWSLHPGYLDPQGLVALWREALLARAVIRGQTKGYRQHTQLERFLAHGSPRAAISSYLAAIHAEATRRGYAFDASKIGPLRQVERIRVARGQLRYEWEHLQRKLVLRNPEWLEKLGAVARLKPHPLFASKTGGIEPWERA